MSSPRELDSAGHVGPAFRSAFPSWGDFRNHVIQASGGDFFGSDRALHQILSADLAMRVSEAAPHDWILMGSLSLPARVSVDPSRWPANLRAPAGSGPSSPHSMARSAFDLDLCAADITDPDPERMATLYGAEVLRAVRAVSVSESGGMAQQGGVGLGGLVRYRSNDLKVFPNGQVMGVVTAEPIDPRYGAHSPIVDDPIGIEIDIKPPNKVQFDGDPEPSQRSVVGIDLPGFSEWRPPLFPTENQLADKVSLLTGPVFTMRDVPPGSWHRYKDLIDSYFIISTCQLDAERLRVAVGTNWNLGRIGRESLPVPYRVYGDGASLEEPSIPWQQGCDKLRQSQPQLRHYPEFAEMVSAVGACLDGVSSAGRGSVWSVDRGWHRSSERPKRTAADIAALGFPGRPQVRGAGPIPPPTVPPGPVVSSRRELGPER